jgi:hypothetical protein
MKRTLCILFALLGAAASLRAQRAEVGAKAPRISGVEWISDAPEEIGGITMVLFFHSSNKECRELIEVCNALAYNFRDNMNVIVLTREPAEQVASLLMHDYQFFYVATDEKGDLFEDFGARHVPYAVIINRKGRIEWTGNPCYIDQNTIQNIINL